MYPTNKKSIENYNKYLDKMNSLFTENNNVYLMIIPDKNYYLEDSNFLHIDYDYIYNVRDLALLKGKAYQSKRNFANRFQKNHPDCQVVPIEGETLEAVKKMLEAWYANRQEKDPLGDYLMERAALTKALEHREELGLEGIALVEDGKVLAMTLGSALTEDTFDVHFEKAVDTEEGAYARINQAFAGYIMEKYPNVAYLNREDDMDLEGLRKAKLSYHPARLQEKYWACLTEDIYED